ncbi:signal recognition particle-docking protein FtsY [Pseudonocardia parietis]|uniref:signal recognition particle-docking protein FtsY n=1 Tax=Pseudonocardia parietis TaxID=570936 RepID=UPI0035590AC4
MDTAEASKDPATRQLTRPDADATQELGPEGGATQELGPEGGATGAASPTAQTVTGPIPDTAPTMGTAPTTDTGTAPSTAPGPVPDSAPTADTGTAPPADIDTVPSTVTGPVPDSAPAATAPTGTAPADSAPTDTASTTDLGSTADTAPATRTDTAPVAPTGPAEEIEPAEGRIGRLRGRLSRSRSGFGQSLLGLLGAGDLDDESWEDVEATLLQADLGPEMTAEITEKLREQLAARGARNAEQVRQTLHDVLVEALDTGQDRSVHALPHAGRPSVLLIVGVNGTGKTTTTGKLARVLVAGGHRVTLGAADTFRAAAAEQLVTWGERSGAGVVRGPEGSDPASVAFDAVKRGTDDGVDAVLLDTAGRLHTKTGLMDELGKVKRVVEKQARVDEVLLVLDATTGQNGLTQARVFGEVVDVTGIALTKLDGTAKGGIVFRVQRELGVPVKLVGLGEGPDDLAPFEPKAFVDALLN